MGIAHRQPKSLCQMTPSRRSQQEPQFDSSIANLRLPLTLRLGEACDEEEPIVRAQVKIVGWALYPTSNWLDWWAFLYSLVLLFPTCWLDRAPNPTS